MSSLELSRRLPFHMEDVPEIAHFFFGPEFDHQLLRIIFMELI
jgi:hypothetical protein